MKRLLVLLILLLPMVALAQDSKNDVTTFRPLGRFKMEGYGYATSPDGFFVAEVSPGMVTDLDGLCDLDEESLVSALAGSSEEELQMILETLAVLCAESETPAGEYDYVLSVWDIRGGKRLWSVQLPFRELQMVAFSPTSDTVLVKTAAPFPSEEEIRLSFYDVKTGDLISETGDIDILDAPVIPGTLPQALNAEPRYTADGQRVMVGYWRRTEAPRCAVWEVATADLIWEKEARCGTLNQDGRLMIIPEPYTNSAYNQIAVYEVATGNLVTTSEDEVLDYAWLDEARVIIHRPYGDPPIIWNVRQNTRAVLELPYPLGSFAPLSLRRVLVYTDQYTVTYIWDKDTGKLLGQTSVEGYAFEREDGVLVLDFDDDTFAAIDLETDRELWRAPWAHYALEARPDGGQLLAVNKATGKIEVFDLNTGKVIGTLPFGEYEFYLTPNWDWLVQVNETVYTIWGREEQADLFVNPPNARTVTDADLYYEANPDFPRGTLPAGTYVWLLHRSDDQQWYQVESVWGDVQWIRASDVELFVSGESLAATP